MQEGKQLTLFLPNYGVMSEFPIIKRHLIAADLISREGIAEIQPGRDADIEKLLLFHTETYINALRTGTPDHLASSAFTWFPELYDISRSRVGSFLDAIERAKADGISGILGGGGHHTRPERGGALSPINGFGVGVHYARRWYRRILVLDLDLHFGNGTAAGFPNDPDLFLFDYHGHAQDFFEPDTPHLFRNLASEPDGATYLARLKEELPDALDQFKPDFCLYLAGMDVFSGSSNPHLRLSAKDIEKREDFVFAQLSERGIPVAYAHGGGYASEETNAKLHVITARAAWRVFVRPSKI